MSGRRISLSAPRCPRSHAGAARIAELLWPAVREYPRDFGLLRSLLTERLGFPNSIPHDLNRPGNSHGKSLESLEGEQLGSFESKLGSSRPQLLAEIIDRSQ